MKKLISLFLIAILSFASFVNTGFASNNMEKSVYIAEGENVEMFAWAGAAGNEAREIILEIVNDIWN